MSANLRFASSVAAFRWRSGAWLILLIIAGFVAPPSPPAAAAGARAEQFIDSLGTRVVDILKDQNMSTADRQTRFKTLFTDTFDAPAIARFVLGRHWKTLNDEQKRSFADLFSEYVAALYAVQFSKYQGQTLKVLGSRAVGENDIAVESQIKRPNNPAPLNLRFRVRQENNGLKVVDVAVDNVSLIITKRSEFNSVIEQEGFNGLMDRMRQALQRINSTARRGTEVTVG